MAKIRFVVPLFASAILLAAPALAVDGVALINNSSALAGGVTPGDAPGYPVTLSVPGSYRLSGNLSVPANVNGIDAVASEVTIDLNGFRMQGAPKSATGVHGTKQNLTVRNGTIRGFAENGLLADGARLIVEDMRITDVGHDGVAAIGGYARIVDSTITGTKAYGIECFRSCHIEGNYVAANQNGVGIGGGTLLGNTIQDNTANGIIGSGPDPVGIGNNTILNNATTVLGLGFVRMHPNYCFPASSAC